MRPCIPSPRWFALSLVLVTATAVGLGLQAADQPAAPSAEAKPSLVTLKMDASLEQVLDELQKQTDIAVDRSRADATRAVKIDVQKVPFWEAVEKIAKSSDHSIAFAEQGRSIQLLGGENMTYDEVPLTIDGAFRLSVRSVTAVFDYGRSSDNSRYEVLLSLHWEPKFSAFLVEVPGKSVTARDNTDKELTVAATEGRMAVTGGGAQMRVRLNDVPRSARTIKLLEGGFHVIGTPKMTEFRFAKVGLEEQSQTKDEVKVKVRADFKEGADLWRARVELEYPEGGPQMESFEAGAWLSENSAFLVSADNRRRMDVNGGLDYDSQSDRRAVINYHWVPPDDGKFGKSADWVLVVRTPSRLIETPVKFKLENIRLP